MKATVMNDEQIQELGGRCMLPPTDYDRQATVAQAVITIAFRAGEKTVVEWIIAHKKGYYAKPDGTLISIISAEWTEEEWQEFLKSEEK